MTKRWYVLHVYSTFEQKVANHIEEQARLKGLSDNIGEILVPTVPVIHVKNGKKVEKESKLFPVESVLSLISSTSFVLAH